MSGEVNVDLRAGLPGGNALVRDYVAGEERARSFFGGDFRSAEAYREKAREVASRFGRSERERAASLVHAPGEGGRERLERWVEGEGVLVATGQQPGLFSGPLYTVYKALTAARLADTLEGVLDRPVLPLFWVASEDHDWVEAGQTWLVDRENELRRIGLPLDLEAEQRPLHRVALDEPLARSVEDFLDALPSTDFSPPLVDAVRRAYAPGRTLPEAFRALLEEILAFLPLVWIDAADPGLKEASLPILLRELEAAEAHEALLARESERVERAGYPVQVPILEGGVNLFLEGSAGRERLYRDGAGRFHLRHSGTALTADDIRRRVEEEPGALSPNVLLRPVVESAVLPVVASVLGPGEIGYFAQLPAFFEAHDLRIPVAHPRTSITVLEGKVEKVLAKFGLAPDDLERPHHELAGEIAREEMPPEVRDALAGIRGAIGQGSARLVQAARDLDPTLKGPVDHARNAAFSAFQEAEKKILQAVKREDEIALSQLEKARVHLRPLGKPQERVLNPFYYLVRYGPGFLKAAEERIVVEIEGASP